MSVDAIFIIKCLKASRYKIIDNFIIFENHGETDLIKTDSHKEFYYTGTAITINLEEIVTITGVECIELRTTALNGLAVDQNIELTSDIKHDFEIE